MVSHSGRDDVAPNQAWRKVRGHRKLGRASGEVATFLARAVRLQQAGKLTEAVVCYEQALSLNPNIPEALSNLGLALRGLGRLDAAVARFEQALALRPDVPAMLSNLGLALRGLGQSDAAIACYRRALTLMPNDPAILSNLAGALTDQGKVDEAVASYERAINLKPSYARAHSGMLLTRHYSESHIARNTLTEARRFARQVEPTTARMDFANSADPDRRLRVGYVSADFRTHPVGIFLEGVLANHDTNNVEVFCYSNTSASDDVTMRLREAARHWRMIVRMADVDADTLIRRDAIDILVDLSGHTRGNRLQLFALKPAPVQVSWLGYVDTTGLAAMDHVLADRFVVPAGDEASFTETVWRLPDTYFCFTPPTFDVPITGRSADRPLMLGSFNNWAKVTPLTIRLWSRVLAEIPDSRLLLKTGNINNPPMRKEILDRFAAHGIGAERLVLENASPRADLLATYNRIDIGLDPFPYAGGLTTAEALWMGVPVVTLLGPRWVSRAGASILTTVGLPQFVADDGESYVRTVKALAGDRRYLDELHRTLRPMVEGSPLCDGRRLTRAAEGLYREMWKAWCAGRSGDRLRLPSQLRSGAKI